MVMLNNYVNYSLVLNYLLFYFIAYLYNKDCFFIDNSYFCLHSNFYTKMKDFTEYELINKFLLL